MDQEPSHPIPGNPQEASQQLPPPTSVAPSQAIQQEPIASSTAGTRQQEERIGTPAWIQAISAVIMVIVTSVYAYYAARQWQTLRDQLHAFQTVEGAHLGVGRLDLDLSTGRAAIPIENHGHVPSPHATIYVHVAKRHAGEPRPFYTRAHTFGGDWTMIPPGAGKYGVTVPVELTPGEAENIQAGQELLMIGVSIRYDNGFGHVTQPGFCFAYAQELSGSWEVCPVVTFEDLQNRQGNK